MKNRYRNNGAKGALLDEYEKAINELSNGIKELSYDELIYQFEKKESEFDTLSIQVVLSHVVMAGYCYLIEIRNSLGENVADVSPKRLNSIIEYQLALQDVIKKTEKLFDDYPSIVLEKHDTHQKIKTSWGQYYDVEQLLEHAIVHVLRHRRQIEKMMVILSYQ